MRLRTSALVLCLVIGGVSLPARQSSLPKVGVTVKEVQAWVTDMIYQSTAAESVWIRDVAPGLSPAAINAIQAMSPAEKLALTQEVLTAIKTTLTSPAFRAEHTARIGKQANNTAVDHGVNADTYGTSRDMDAVTASRIARMIQMLRSLPPQAVQQAFEDERAELAETIKDETGEERAKAQKYLTELNTLAPLMKSNPEEFTKQYTLAKSASLGGPDTEAKFQAVTASAEDTEKIRMEQVNWNRYNLNQILKKNLNKFVEQATQVDLKQLATIPKDGEIWGLDQMELYLGPPSIAAAVQFARAWLKEL